MLKTKKKVIFEVDYNNLDQFLNEEFGLGGRFEFVAVEECGNDSNHQYEVTGTYREKYPNLAKYEENVIRDWEAGKFVMYSTHRLLEEACRRGKIEPGTYLIRVSW